MESEPFTYQCAMCKGTFESDWTRDDALAELHFDFGNIDLKKCDVICDDCYQQVRPDEHPKELSEWKAAHDTRQTERER